MKRAQLTGRVRRDLPRHEPLNAREEAFVREYLLDFNQTQAVVRSGYTHHLPAAAAAGSELVRKPKIQARIQEELRRRRERAEMTADEVAQYWHALATADARELAPVRRGACRFCHGFDHEYQFTQHELRELRRAHQKKYEKVPADARPMLDEKGGDGYNATSEPHPECPECNGLGMLVAVPPDLSKLSYGASLLYDGIKISASGTVEIKLRDRSRAMENFQQVRGFAVPRRVARATTLEDLTDDELDLLLAQARVRGLISDADVPSLMIEGRAEEVK